MTQMYRFTHRAVELIQDDASSADTAVPAEVSIPSLTMFSTILFMAEFYKMGLGDSVDISKTCNMSEWHRRIYAGAESQPLTESQEEEYIDIMTLPPKPTSQAGLIYATTHKDQSQAGSKEAFSSFLFALHKPAFSKTFSPISGISAGPSPEAQALVSTSGVTHIWLCGSDPEHRRHHLMSRCLDQLEKDVLEWKVSGQGSGVLTVHTIPLVFPGMVQFLLRNGFKGGDSVVGGESGKVLYWKVL